LTNEHSGKQANDGDIDVLHCLDVLRMRSAKHLAVGSFEHLWDP